MWTIPLGVVRVICSPYVCDYRIYVDNSVGSCACPIVLCVSSKVANIPFQPKTYFHPLPLQWNKFDTSNTKALTRHANPIVWRQRRPLSRDDKQELRHIFMIMENGPSYQMGLLHQMVWGLIGTSYQGYPLNVGESSTINISGTRRRGRWQADSSQSLLNLCTSIMEFVSSPSEMFVQWTHLSRWEGVLGWIFINHIRWWRQSGLA